MKSKGATKSMGPAGANTIDRYFWVIGGLLCILLISIMAQDINRPFTGLHSWAEAHGAWAARAHVNYGLGYTKGLTTWAVGNPPTQNPKRYFDHPQLGVLLNTAVMRIVGVNEAGRRITKIVISVMALLLFLRIVSCLINSETALLAGLLYALFPLTGYFGLAEWTMLFGFWAIWCYLVLTGLLRTGPEPKTLHKIGLAAGLFLGLQCGWHGFFYALGIGVHYVGLCVFRKHRPNASLLAILIAAPLLSMGLNFTIMTGGYGWKIQPIIELYKWRSAKGEMAEFKWGAWFAVFWEHARTNFTIPVLIVAILYLTFGQLLVFSAKAADKSHPLTPARRFPQLWLLLITPVAQVFLLRGALWKHQTWERPFAPFIAIAAALGILLLADVLTKARPILAKIVTAVLMLIVTIACAKGLNHYHSIIHFSPEKVKLFTTLNERIPPDKMLLSFEALTVEQHSAKGAFYRPEIAWYLDREIVRATTLAEIDKQARTGKFLYYLMPTTYYTKEASDYLAKLNAQLRQRYKSTYIAPDPGGPSRAPMLPYMIFDLRSRVSGDI
jgi:4-amino-4-deoxy-L-arabinose transferase-like glycosyltransferase